jgi:hypothetical protein
VSNHIEPGGAVVPVAGGIDADRGYVDPWQMLAQGTGLLVTWQDPPATVGDSWGAALRGTSALSAQLGSVVARAGGSATSGAAHFIVEIPNGGTLKDLIPAVGGGYRGMVRAADGSTRIGDHVKLFPVGGAAVGAGIALGPVVALMALSVGAEMLARHQQDKKLDAIRRGVRSLAKAADETMAAQLQSAEQALELGSAAVLDHISIPDTIGLGTARHNLSVIRNRATMWLAGWEERAEAMTIGRTGVSFATMRKVLAGDDSGDDYKHFPLRVATLYRALALDSRALVLIAVEASLRNPDQTLHHLQAQLHRALHENATAQDRLKEVLWKLTEAPLADALPTMPAVARDLATLDRTLAQLAAGAARLPDAPALLNSSNRQVLEVLRDHDGAMRVMRPALSAG